MTLLEEILITKDMVNIVTLVRDCFAEFLGTMAIVLVGCGSCVQGWEDSTAPTIVHISLAFGFIVAGVVACFGDVSGSHVNPAVTVGLFTIGKVGLIRVIAYILFQLIGAILGACILSGVTPNALRSSLGQVTVHGQLTVIQAFFVETILTFCLVMAVCAVTDSGRKDSDRLSAPCIIGFVIAAVHLFGIKYTGSSINPARALGPCIFTGVWDNHWIYWLGPMTGAITAAPIYQFIFRAKVEVPVEEETHEPDSAEKEDNLGTPASTVRTISAVRVENEGESSRQHSPMPRGLDEPGPSNEDTSKPFRKSPKQSPRDSNGQKGTTIAVVNPNGTSDYETAM